MKITYRSVLGKSKTYYKWNSVSIYFPEYLEKFKFGVTAKKGLDVSGNSAKYLPNIRFDFGKRGILIQFEVKGEN